MKFEKTIVGKLMALGRENMPYTMRIVTVSQGQYAIRTPSGGHVCLRRNEHYVWLGKDMKAKYCVTSDLKELKEHLCHLKSR